MYNFFTSVKSMVVLVWLVFSGNIYSYGLGDLSINSNGEIFITSQFGWFAISRDDGLSWTKIPLDMSENSEYIHYMYVDKQDNLYVIEDFKMWVSNDNGNSWILKELPNRFAANLIKLSNGNMIYSAGSWDYRDIKISSDDGDTWQTAHHFETRSVINAMIEIDHPDGNYAFVVFGDGKIVVSDDYGYSWWILNENIDPNNWIYIQSFFCDSQSTLYAGTNNVYRATNGGNSWERMTNYTSGDLIHAFCELNDEIFFVRNREYAGVSLAKSSDHGLTWNEMNAPEPDLHSIISTPEGTLLIVGDYIWRSADLGNTWELSIEGLGLSGIDDPDNTIPRTFELSQNYPNPFNPSTSIEYSIPKQSHVTIKVYDLLGREITTLLNEAKPAGNYSVNFDGSGLSSGVYFYRLTTDKFNETKKLLLLK